MSLDLEASVFPNATRDNFGSTFGLLTGRYMWHVGERTQFLANAVVDPFNQGQRVWNAGILTQRGPRGSLYFGFRQVEAQPPQHDGPRGLSSKGQVLLVQRREEMLVLQALRELPLEQQTALELNLLENLSGREISELLGVAEGTVRSRLRLGLDRLRRRVAELAATPDELESTLSDLAAWARNIRAVIDGAPA